MPKDQKQDVSKHCRKENQIEMQKGAGTMIEVFSTRNQEENTIL